jgi:hypothetical protein
MGQKVNTVVDSYLGAGHHTFTWDGASAASGVYFYRLAVNNDVYTKKMIMMK